MTDIVTRLRALSRHEHDDLTIGDEAADEIESLRTALRIVADDELAKLLQEYRRGYDDALSGMNSQRSTTRCAMRSRGR